jgi:hypothetical protein
MDRSGYPPGCVMTHLHRMRSHHFTLLLFYLLSISAATKISLRMDLLPFLVADLLQHHFSLMSRVSIPRWEAAAMFSGAGLEVEMTVL